MINIKDKILKTSHYHTNYKHIHNINKLKVHRSNMTVSMQILLTPY